MSAKCLGVTTEGIVSLLNKSGDLFLCTYDFSERKVTWHQLTPKTLVSEKS